MVGEFFQFIREMKHEKKNENTNGTSVQARQNGYRPKNKNKNFYHHIIKQSLQTNNNQQ